MNRWKPTARSGGSMTTTWSSGSSITSAAALGERAVLVKRALARCLAMWEQEVRLVQAPVVLRARARCSAERELPVLRVLACCLAEWESVVLAAEGVWSPMGLVGESVPESLAPVWAVASGEGSRPSVCRRDF